MEKYHLHYHHLLTQDKFKQLLVSNTFRNVALAMISIFVPIFLLKNGFSLTEVLFYELAYLILAVGMHFLNLMIACFIGLKKTLILSSFLSIIYYVALYSYDYIIHMTGRLTFLVIAGVLNAIAFTMFWTAHHLYFINTTNKREGITKVGVLASVPVIFSIISPFLGSLLITHSGFKVTFITVALLLGIGSLFLLFTQEVDVEYKIDYTNILQFDNMGKNLVYFIQGFGFIATGFLWPIFIYLSSIKIMIIGFFYMASNLVYAAFCYFAGKWSDKYGDSKVAKIGTVGFAGSLVIRVLQKSSLAMSLVQNIGGMTGALMLVPLQGMFYKIAHQNTNDMILNRELYMHLGRICGLCIVFLLVTLLSAVIAMMVSIILCGIVTMFMLIFVDALKRRQKLPTFEED